MLYHNFHLSLACRGSYVFIMRECEEQTSLKGRICNSFITVEHLPVATSKFRKWDYERNKDQLYCAFLHSEQAELLHLPHFTNILLLLLTSGEVK